jgi:hypothetical protein
MSHLFTYFIFLDHAILNISLYLGGIKMTHKNALTKAAILIGVFITCCSILYGDQGDINQLVLYLADHDIIMTQNTENQFIYEGYDYGSKANYKVTADKTGKINDFTIDLADTAYEKLNLDKVLGLKWFISHYLEKNDEFITEIKNNIKNADYHHSAEIDLGEWKVNLFVFPLSGGKLDISLHFIEDAATAETEKQKNMAALLKDVYKELGALERKTNKMKSDQISYKLPYYKLNPSESIYYNSFINKHHIVYKTQFIFYKKGFEFDYKNIPQLKQIITLVSRTKNYPFDKLNVQFNHLREFIINDKKNMYTSRSSWNHENVRTVMDVERYINRDQCRIKITVYLEKK